MKNQLVIGGTYRHYKDKLYVVTGVARHSETLEEMIIYEAQYENKLGKVWVRPKDMFLSEVETENYTGPRFSLVKK